MPFLTEEIWQKLGGREPSIMVAAYPTPIPEWDDADAERRVAVVQEIITRIRNLRAEKGFSPRDRFLLYLKAAAGSEADFFREHGYLLLELARLSEVRIGNSFPADAHLDSIRGIEIAIEVPKRTVSAEESARIRKQIEQLAAEVENTKRLLQDTNFIERAPAHVVEGTRQREAELIARLEKLRQNIAGP